MGQKFKADPPLGQHERVITLGPARSEWVHLGRLAELGPSRPVHLGLDTEHVLAIVGKRGSGKSFTLGTVLEGLCAREAETPIARSSKQRSALLFDTLNIFQWMGQPVGDADSASSHVAKQARLLREWKVAPVELDIDLWTPAGYIPTGAPTARPFRIRTSDMTASDWAALIGVDLVQDIMGQLVGQLTDKVTKRGWVRANGSEVAPSEDYQIADLLACLAEDADLANDYTPQSLRAVRQRLNAYESSPLFGDNGTALHELLTPGRLSILLLSGVDDDVRLVCIYLTLRKLLQARARASEAAKSLELGGGDGNDVDRLQALVDAAPPKTWVVIDEAQNVFPSERQTAASTTLLRFVREGRNFGLSLAFTTQQPTALDSNVMAQVDTFIVHTLTVQCDLTEVLKSLKSPEPTFVALRGRPLGLADAIRSLAVGQTFVSSSDTTRSLFMDVRPRVSVHGGFEG